MTSLVEEVRKERGMTRQELASDAGLSVNAIWMLESSLAYNPQLATIVRVAEVLGLDYTDIADEFVPSLRKAS